MKKQSGSIGIVGIVFVACFGFIVYRCSSGVNESFDRAAAKEAAKTPAQRAADERESKADSTRLRAAIEMARIVRRHAKDPDSVKFVQIAVNEDGNLVCATYRAKNSFNATVPGSMVIFNQTFSDKTSEWKKRCAKAIGMRDYTRAG